jgi:aspartate carbamoyltransferase catalytic subunit
MRHPSPGACAFLEKKVNARIINAGDGAHEHPTQALLDSFTLIEKFGDLNGRKIVIIGDILHSRVAMSNIFCLQKLGAEVSVCGPATLIPKFIKSLGVGVCVDVDEALNWADAAIVLRIQLERQDTKYFPSLSGYKKRYGINRQRLERLGCTIPIMHPGPINRGVELSSDVADGPSSLILGQVENGVAVRMACLYLLGSKCRL